VEQSAAAARLGIFFLLGDGDRGILRLSIKSALYKYAYLLTYLIEFSLNENCGDSVSSSIVKSVSYSPKVMSS